MAKEFRVLIASEGSPSARAARAIAIGFPWPDPSRARGVVALGPLSPHARPALIRDAIARALGEEIGLARRALAERWPDAEVVAVRAAPADAILDSARRWRAASIVLGWRGHGTFRRLLMGSVSRAVVRRAHCPVLVVPRAARSVRRFVVGFDGSPQARRAVRLLGRLEHGPGSLAMLVSVVEPTVLPTLSRLPEGVRESIRREAAALDRDLVRQARRRTEAAAARLRTRGWRVRVLVRMGVPLETLLAAADEFGADVLVVGARAVSGVERMLLGSVASGALDHAGRPVLIVP